jgi:arylsulfatase A-like enzyme
MMFTDYYAEQSCTAGRAAFITGQMPIRTGLTKVGTPGADVGIQPEDPTLAELLKPLGYATGQFGKNHLDDLDAADDTIVIYATDNGPHFNQWPDAGFTPFSSSKNTNWEGGYRVPCIVRWPGQIEPDSFNLERVIKKSKEVAK